MATQPSLKFQIYKGDELVREETLSQPVIKIGKLSSSHLKLDDDAVSRMHAVIEITPSGDISIIDLGSSGGTQVNGQRVNKAKLQAGDSIVVGNTKIVLSVEEAAAAAPAPEATPAAPSAPARAAAPAMPVAPAATSAPPPSFSAPAPSPAPIGLGGYDSVGAIDAEEAGPQVVEVTAMLGDSMVGVKHSLNPKGGKTTAKTKLLAGLGIAGVLIAAAVLFIGVSNSKADHHSRKAWNSTDKKAKEAGLPQRKPHRWRPGYVEQLREYETSGMHTIYDVAYLGGLFGGLTLLVWAVGRYKEEQISPYFRIGTDAEVEFPTSDAPASSFALVAPQGDAFVLNYTNGMKGELETDDGNRESLQDLQGSRAAASSTEQGALSFEIPPNSRTQLSLGQNTFFVSSVNRPKRHPVPFAAGRDAAFNYALLGVLGIVAIIFLINYWHFSEEGAGIGYDDKAAFAKLEDDQNKAKDDPLLEEQETDDNAEDDPGGTGTAAALEEGLMGKKDSQRATGLYKMKKINDMQSLAKKELMALSTSTGAVGALSGSPDMFASLTGLSDISSGMDDASIQGGLLGDEYGEMAGGFGMGRSGFGPGGGGTGWGTVGLGNQGLIGRGSGTGDGWGIGSGSGGGRGRKAKVPPVRIGSPTVSGDLDKSIIRRYIRRKLPQIKYCYEKQLLVKQGLGGTVSTSFLISQNGSVKNSTASGVDAKVSSCVAQIIGTIRFPKPKGGGLVQVRYPFRFNPPAN